MNGCNFCNLGIDCCTKIEHPQQGEAPDHLSKIKRTFYRCGWCEEIWIKEETLFQGNKVSEEIKPLGKNSGIKL